MTIREAVRPHRASGVGTDGFLMFESSFVLAVLIATLYCLALIIIFFTLTKSNDELDVAALGEEFERNDTHSLLFLSS